MIHVVHRERNFFYLFFFFLCRSSSPWERHLTKIDSSKVSSCLSQIKFLFFSLKLLCEFFFVSFYAWLLDPIPILIPERIFAAFSSLCPIIWAFNNLLSLITSLSIRFHLFYVLHVLLFQKGKSREHSKRRFKWLDVSSCDIERKENLGKQLRLGGKRLTDMKTQKKNVWNKIRGLL